MVCTKYPMARWENDKALVNGAMSKRINGYILARGIAGFATVSDECNDAATGMSFRKGKMVPRKEGKMEDWRNGIAADG